MKIAVLILCHKNADQINLFLQTMKHESIDFYIHVDKKSNITSNLIRGSNIHVLQDSFRVDVGWGEYSQVQATLNLLNTAKKYGTYDYFWLCSGQDFPIKSMKFIIEYLSEHKGKNFFQLLPSKNYKLGQENNFDKRNIVYFPKNILGNKFIKKVIKRIYVEISGGYNHTYKIFRRRDEIAQVKSYFGSQWFCATNELIQWMLEYLEKNTWYEHCFSHCSCPDESFFHTLFMLSPYANSRMDFLHYIDWSQQKKNPKLLSMADFEEIRKSNYLMARKIDINVSNDLVQKIINLITIRY